MNSLAHQVLTACQRGETIPNEWIESLAAGDPRELFQQVVEPLSDAFEPAYCDAYTGLFSRLIADSIPGLDAAALRERYEILRRPRLCSEDPQQIFVLSRVTLGADVAITSVMLDAAKKRFPKARILFAGPQKNYELFAGDPRIEHLPVSYARHGGWKARLQSGLELQAALQAPGSIVIDPDSRLTQLGMLPVCDPQRCYFFESRAYGGDSEDSLGTLARRWASETFGVEASAYIALAGGPIHDEEGLVTVSLGVGENQAKRVHGSFEKDLIAWLVQRRLPLLIDQGAGGEEAERVKQVIADSGAAPGQIRTWLGQFAPSASISRSRFYIGYDSSGQHVAAACGVPLVAIFKGFTSSRMFHRWQPSGWGLIEVRRLEGRELSKALPMVFTSVEGLLLST